MRVVVQVISELHGGRRALLMPGQAYQVGRSEMADMALVHDPQLSGFHFELKTDHAACYLQDLNSRNGTRVNGQPVTRAVLRDGDRITAGGTQFEVHIEGDRPEQAAPRPLETAPVAATAERQSGSRQAAVAFEAVPCTLGPCRSGLTVLISSHPEPPPETVLLALQKAFPLYLVVDLNKLEPPLPEMSNPPEWLLPAIPEEARPKHSPVILAADAKTDISGLVQQCWRRDCLIAVYSEEAPELVREQLQRFAGGFMRPSILKPQLTETTKETAEALLSRIEAIVVEDDSAGGWMLLLAREELLETLAKLGFSPESKAAGDQDHDGTMS